MHFNPIFTVFVFLYFL